jgi:hypothetical protein
MSIKALDFLTELLGRSFSAEALRKVLIHDNNKSTCRIEYNGIELELATKKLFRVLSDREQKLLGVDEQKIELVETDKV